MKDQQEQNRIDAISRLKFYIQEKLKKKEKPQLIFICTHNSRRSQLAQFWSYYWAKEMNLPIDSYSGGTEVTACNERTIACLEEMGFEFISEGEGNPKYQYSEKNNHSKLNLFSKIYDQDPNPTENFAAIMICSHADANCPIISGADLRISLPFEDPGKYDGTDGEKQAYRDCSDKISAQLKELYQAISIET